MKRNDEIGALLTSITRGEEHIVKIKIDTTLRGMLAVQYKLLRLLKNEEFDERSFVNMIVFAGLAQVSKTLLKELLSVHGVTYGLLKKLFNDFEKGI